MAADKETYLPGEAVIITIRVTNVGNGIADIRFGSTCLATYSILSVDGSVVYDDRAHAASGQMLTNWTLRPGDARVFTFTWTQTTDSGIPVPSFRSYRVQGALPSTKPFPSPSTEARIFVMRGASGPDLAFTARADRTSCGPRDSANVTVILANIGLDTVMMHFGSPCFVQFLVLDEARHAVYNSSKWWGCVQLLTDEILAPGEPRSWAFPWGLTTDAGGSPLVSSTKSSLPSSGSTRRTIRGMCRGRPSPRSRWPRSPRRRAP